MENPMQSHTAKNPPLDMEKWRAIVEAWATSGESQKVYCQRLGISLNSFSYVRTKLMSQNKSKSQFIPLTINKCNTEKSISQSLIILENPYGYKLHLSASLSLEQLTKLFMISGWKDA